MNYAGLVSIACPFISALTGFVTAVGAQANLATCVVGLSGGFVVGALLGAVSVGVTNVLLSYCEQVRNKMWILGLAIAYLALPVVLTVVACIITKSMLAWIF
jgi:hypothetical protein